METYHKINAPFKRHMSGPDKGKLIHGEWARTEYAYLANNEWEFTEKVDGTNIRIHLRRYTDWLYVDFGGRTDKAVLPAPLLDYLHKMFPATVTKAVSIPPARECLVGRWMLDNNLQDVILFGEGYGAKIQNGGNYRDDQAFVLFDVKIGDFWLDRDSVNDVAEHLGIDAVPVLGRGTIYDAIRMVKGERIGLYDDEGEMVYSNLPMLSKWGDFEAEGIVARPVVPLFDRKGDRIILKIKGRDFK